MSSSVHDNLTEFVPPDHARSGFALELSRDVETRIRELEEELNRLRPLARLLAIVERPDPTLDEICRAYTELAFTSLRGNRTKTAAFLDIGVRTLNGWLRLWGYPPCGGPGSNRPRRDAP